MPYDVFISYSKPDKTTADAVCGTLEGQGVRCWIAPRDVEPGRDWSESIIEALNHCPVMVLVFSSHANGSPQVRREVQRAFEKNITVIPLRVENVMPVQSLEYYIGPVHWLDALTPPLDSYLQQLSRTVKRLLADRNTPEERGAAATAPVSPSPGIETPPPVPHLARPERPPVADSSPPSRATGADTETVGASVSPASRALELKRRSLWLPLGICAIAGLTIFGVAYVWRMQRPEPAKNADETAAVATVSDDQSNPVFEFHDRPADETAPKVTLIPQGAEDGGAHGVARIPWPATTTGDGGGVVTTMPPDGALPEELRALFAQRGGPTSGQPWTVPDLELTLVFIRPGSFTMGSAAGEKHRLANEGPLTRVTISEGFWLGKFEVTRAQWSAIMRAGAGGEKDADGDTPIEGITWTDAMQFCRLLTERESAVGRVPPDCVYALPSEAQWEYACRAGTTTPFHFGERLSADMANFDGSQPYGGASEKIFRTQATRAGSFAPNAWGLFDMHGNVAEWTSTIYARSLPGGSVTDPTGPTAGRAIVVRGGSWQDAGWECRSAMRVEAGLNVAADHIGFRVALAPVH